MPGLSQLKKFSNDMVSLGNEVQVRASRGEKPVKVEIPDTVETLGNYCFSKCQSLTSANIPNNKKYTMIMPK